MPAHDLNEDSEWAGWENLSPVLRHANFFDAPPGGGFGPRYLQDFQILVMQAGRGTMTIGHVEYEIAPGDAVFYGPNVQHQAISSESHPLRLAGIHFVMRAQDEQALAPQFQFGREVPIETGVATLPLWPPPAPKISVGLRSEVHHLCEALILSFFIDQSGRKLEKRGLILQLLQAWHDATMKQSGAKESLPARHREALALCEQKVLENLRRPPSPAHLAALAELSEGHFAVLFKKHFGYTLGAFVTRHRLLEARRLLVQGRLSVKEVAFQVGFNDPFHFSRLFTRNFGVAPSRLRNRKPE